MAQPPPAPRRRPSHYGSLHNQCTPSSHHGASVPRAEQSPRQGSIRRRRASPGHPPRRSSDLASPDRPPRAPGREQPRNAKPGPGPGEHSQDPAPTPSASYTQPRSGRRRRQNHLTPPGARSPVAPRRAEPAQPSQRLRPPSPPARPSASPPPRPEVAAASRAAGSRRGRRPNSTRSWLCLPGAWLPHHELSAPQAFIDYGASWHATFSHVDERLRE